MLPTHRKELGSIVTVSQIIHGLIFSFLLLAATTADVFLYVTAVVAAREVKENKDWAYEGHLFGATTLRK
jgi:hypothetical protein